MADDHSPAGADTYDTDTDEGLEAYLEDLHARRPLPERLRYPETDEAYARMIAEADQGGYISFERVKAWSASLGTDHPLPRPEPEPE